MRVYPEIENLRIYFERKTVFPEAALFLAASRISITIKLFSKL